MLSNIIVLPNLMIYNIVLGHDYIYAMQVVVSSLFRVMMFPHEGHLIAIYQLSYHDPPSHASHNKTTLLVVYTESMHYVSTTTDGVETTPIECEPVTLVPPPHNLGLEVGKAHLPSGTPT